MTDVMRERGTVVNSAAQMLASGDVNLDTLPDLILRIINEDMWQQRAIPQHNWQLTPVFGSFEEFCTTGPLDGLGVSVPSLRDLCRRNIRAQEAIDRATQHETGVHGGYNIPTRPEGTSQAKALRRLRKDRPDLLERVLDGELSAHAAAVQAGFRHPVITVQADNPESAARTLRKVYDPEDRKLLARLLEAE